jgi:hypothetical protein
MTANSNSKTRRRKTASNRPDKPYPDFPMTPHAGGKWVKKIRGKLHYFGRWGRMRDGKMERLPDDGWQEALKLFKAQWPDLKEGHKPRGVKDGQLTLAELCNRFLTAKLQRDPSVA